MSGNDTNSERDEIHAKVRERYSAAALAVTEMTAGCCGPAISPSESEVFGASQYDDETRQEAPATASLASLGCGNPVAVADLHVGETVLDLGSGAGLDVLLSARRVGPEGMAYGLDMTDEMLELAQHNAADAGVTNVQFLKGMIEEIPLPDASVDVVISNCVINLSPEKTAVFTEMARVLRPGGRIGISDVVAEDELTTSDRAERGSYSGCIAGALSFAEYRDQLEAAGLTEIQIDRTNEVADRMWSAIVRAVKPG